MLHETILYVNIIKILNINYINTSYTINITKIVTLVFLLS